VVGCSKAPTPRRTPKAHHVANKTQERHCARSFGTNVLVLQQTRDKFTLPLIVLQTHENVLTGWVDSDFAADSDTRCNVTGYVMVLNGAPISWRSCHQGGVTLSSSEAEYVAASAVAQENAYLRALLSGFDCSPLGVTCMWEANPACNIMSENPVNRDRSHHSHASSMLNFNSSASEYVPVKSSYASVRVPSTSQMP